MSNLSIFVSMAVYMLFLFLFLEYTREKQSFYKWFSIVALLTFPLWFLNLSSWFRWAKTISILLPLLFLTYVRIANDGEHNDVLATLRGKWPLWILYLVLILNIAEASLKDITLGNYFNAMSGVLLCITIPLPTKHWRIGNNDKKNSFAELIADFPLAWCLLYVTWNAAFVYAENIGYFASSLCILIVPEIWMYVRKRTDLWLMGRVYTLAVHLLIRGCYDIFTPIMDSTAWQNESLLYAWGAMNLVLHFMYFVYWVLKLRNKDYIVKHSAQAYGI